MKITFLIPPVLHGNKPSERTAGCTYVLYSVPNIYELTVAAILEEEGYEIRYFDFVMEKKNRIHFEEFLKEDDSDFYSIWTVNLGIENDLIAHSIIRKYQKETGIMFMGPAPTYYTDRFLIDPNSFVIRGEPDITSRELIKAVVNNSKLDFVDGISFVNSEKKITHNKSRDLIKNLDEIPFPARHLIEKFSYYNPKLKVSPYTVVVSSRNCPHKCIFCVPSSLTFAREIEFKKDNDCKPPVSLRSTKNVAKEIENLANMGFKSISFQDDNFIWNETRTKEICEVLRKHKIFWGCQARVDSITETIAKELASSYCQYVDLGVESYNQEILDYIKKEISVQQIENAVKLLKKYNVPVKLNILLGTSPLETKKNIKETFKKIKELNVSQVMFNIAAPFPGTEFYKIARKNGWMTQDDYFPTDVQKKSIVSYPYMTDKEMEKQVFWGNIKFFLRPSFVIKNVVKFRSFNDFRSALKALWRKLFA